MRIYETIRKMKVYKKTKPKHRINPDKADKSLLTFTDANNKIIPWYTPGGEFFGLLWCHRPYYDWLVDADEAAQCGSSIHHCEAMLSLENKNHELRSVNPMTIEPSLVCPTCYKHGVLIKGTYHEVSHRLDFSDFNH